MTTPRTEVIRSIRHCRPAGGRSGYRLGVRLLLPVAAFLTGLAMTGPLMAEAAGTDISVLRQRLIDAAQRAQDKEAAIAGLDKALIDLARDLGRKEAALASRRQEQAALASALLRVGRRPPEAMLAMPGPPVDVLRTLFLLKSTLPSVHKSAQLLSGQLAEIHQLRAEIALKRRSLSAARDALGAEQEALDRLLAERIREERRLAAEEAERWRQKVRSEAAARAADGVDELVESLSAIGPSRSPVEPEPLVDEAGAVTAIGTATPTGPAAGRTRSGFAAAKGRLPLPAIGRPAGLFNQRDAGGRRLRGLRLETASGARITAPYDGIVSYAGPFRGYGQILIIDHGEGYHSVLAGLGRIDSITGQWLLAGEPVGIMDPKAGARAIIYFELRHLGRPINPLPWLAVPIADMDKAASTNGKVNG